MKKARAVRVLLVILLTMALLLSGCGASRSFYFSGNDDPLSLREIQGRIYEERNPFAALGQDSGRGTQEGQTETSENGNSGENAANAQNDSTAESGMTSEEGATNGNSEAAGETGTSETSGNGGTEDNTETAENSSDEETEDSTAPEDSDAESSDPEQIKYDEAYCDEYYALGKAILDEIGWDLKAAYDWCVAITYFNGTPIDADLGTLWYANLGFETHRGNCYTYAATLTVMARLLGYEARQVNGHIKGYEDLHHSWVEIDIDGVTYTCDPEYEWERGKDGYLKEYGKSGIWLLNNEELTYMPDEPTTESLDALEEAGWPRSGPYASFIEYWEYQLYLARRNNESSEESDPNGGCIGDDVPEQE